MQRAIEKSEAEIIEEEIRQYYSELLLKKIQLELDLGITDSENEVGDGLELQREKLKKDLYEVGICVCHLKVQKNCWHIFSKI